MENKQTNEQFNSVQKHSEWSELKLHYAKSWWTKGRGVFNTELYLRFLEIRLNSLNNNKLV